MLKKWCLTGLAAGLVSVGLAHAQQHDAGLMHQHHMSGAAANDGAQHGHGEGAMSGPDLRVLVKYPDELRRHTLASMRQHLETIQGIQSALAAGDYDLAANLAEQRLGMSSLHDHKASENAQYMPAEMAAIGTGMHRAASQFAVVARDASVSGDLKMSLAALSRLTAQCTACHAGFKLQ